jgi:hypothetical protein
MKVTEAIFKFHAKDGKAVYHNVYDYERFLRENEGVELYGTYKQANKLSEKWKMYNYYYGVILQCAILAYTKAGWPGVDKVKADYLLRAEFAKDFILGPNGKQTVIMLDKSGMTKARLLKLLQDCIQYLEEEFGQECPDSTEWKMKKETGREFKEHK